MTEFCFYWITGFSVGIEWAHEPEENINAFILDLGILRLMWLTHLED